MKTLSWLSLVLLLLFLLCSSSTTLPTPVKDYVTDRSVLLDIKNRLTGDPAGALTSWNETTTTHYCQWAGVTCGREHNHQRVAALDLRSMGLAGPISPSIGNLTFLTTLYLANNEFDGEISPTIGRLRRLQQLNMSFNSFTGAIPVNLTYCLDLRLVDLKRNQLNGKIPVEFGSLPKLVALVLESNNLTGSIPDSFGNLSSLTFLSLNANPLEGNIPDGIGRLSNLEYIHLSFNGLSGTIPSSLFNLSSLYMISVAYNQLEGILPASLGDTLPKLENLLLAGNYFSGSIPVSLANVSSLTYIDLPANYLSGQVPRELGRLRQLESLNLNHNQLEAKDHDTWEFFTSLTNCTQLFRLDVAYNNLVGVLPSSIANFSSTLQALQLQHNKITGGIDPGIDKLVGLNGLALHSNLLTGSIPQGIGKLSKLEYLGLYKNKITGQIPSSIGNLTQLTYLGLADNYLEGPIPPSLGKLQRLNALALSNNNLNGIIPKEITNLSSLNYVFNLAYNSLVGPLPPEVGSLKDLEAFNVSNNQLSGEIPSTVSGCRVLAYLVLDNNLFQGPVPQSLGSMKGLINLVLSHNNLSGPIPESLQNLNGTRLIDLSFNRLEGEVPTEGPFRNASVLSLVGNKGLCGGVSSLHLSPCTPRSIPKRGKHSLLKVVVPTVSAALISLALFLGLAYVYRKKMAVKKNPKMPLFDEKYQRVSYDELAKATDGFSSANVIGSGSFGSVYKGTLDHGDTTVAVKVFNLEQHGASKSFTVECDTLRSIRHRNLLKIITSCSSVDARGNDFRALVFEYMPKGSLEACLHVQGAGEDQPGNLSLLQRLNIAINIADALGYLHHDCQPPVVHCDLKPSNVLIKDDMVACVSDFGLAQLIPEALSRSLQDSSNSIALKGSIGYVAPEYGSGCQVSTVGDAYSYGILLLEMLTGRRPVDDMFEDGLNLHDFVKMAFPDRVMEIVDPLMRFREDGNGAPISEDATKECLKSMLRIGLSCSNQTPTVRMNTRDAAAAMHGIAKVYLIAIQGDRQQQAQARSER